PKKRGWLTLAHASSLVSGSRTRTLGSPPATNSFFHSVSTVSLISHQNLRSPVVSSVGREFRRSGARKTYIGSTRAKLIWSRPSFDRQRKGSDEILQRPLANA